MLVGAPRRLAWLSAAGYLTVLLALTLTPAPPDDAEAQSPFWVNLRPFDTIMRSLSGQTGPSGLALLAGNIVAFIPLGVLLPLLSSRPSLLKVGLAGASLSLAIEAAQLSLSLLVNQPYRHADVDDVMLNTGGALLGYVAISRLAGAAGASSGDGRD